MERVSVSRTFAATPEEVREEIRDVEPFMEGCGFDEVSVDGDSFTITNHVGLLSIQLDLKIVETDDALVYEQIDGIFEEMVTRYHIEDVDDGASVTATTEFALDARLVGPILDATIITRQRKKELEAQFDYLEEALDSRTKTAA